MGHRGPETLGHRRRARDGLTGGQHVAGAECVLEPQLDRVDPQPRREPIHL
jgi:hypothetical protein